MKKKSIKIKKTYKKILKRSQKLRLSVFKSNKHIYTQIINDKIGHTLIFSNSLQFLDEELTFKLYNKLIFSKFFIKKNESKKKFLSYLVGNKIALKSNANNISTIVFDRAKYIYHGRIKALGQSARKKGLIF